MEPTASAGRNILGIAHAGSIHTHKWANYFANHGWHVHVLSYAPISERPEGLDPRVSIADWILPNVHFKRPWITLRALGRLRSAISAHHTHLVHAHFLGAGAWFAALAGQRPLVVSVMGGGDITGTTWRPTTWRERLLTPYSLGRADLVTCWSTNLARMIRPMVSAKVRIEVLNGGVDLDVFTRRPNVAELRHYLAVRPEDPVILSPRLFWPRQNIETIVRAMPLILSKRPQARLVLVKYLAAEFPKYEWQIETLIEQLGIRWAIREVPQIPNRQMPEYYSLSNCTVSIPTTDGTPMTVMESLACETPVVVSDLADYDSQLFVDGHTVVRVNPADPAGLAAAILGLLDDNLLRERMGRNGRRMVGERADYRSEMSRLEHLYRSLVPDVR
jgi:glycosyltransferase involved in cell wall biosynthesis